MARPRLAALRRGAALMLLGIGVASLAGHLRHVITNQEKIMADFSKLDDGLAELKQGIVDAAQRVEDAVNKLLNADATDQAQVDEALADVNTSIASLRGIAPSALPAPEPEPAPEPPPGI